MQESIKSLLKKFDAIKKQGFIEATSNYKNNSGILFEKLVGSSGGDFCFPDFEGIELKVIRNYYDASIELFNLTPNSCHLYTTQWLTNNYGYPDKNFKKSKVLKGNAFANTLCKIGLFYFLKIRVNRIKERLELEIYNHHKTLINNDAYWDFDEIKERLELKLKYLALINIEKKIIDGKLYFMYKDLRIYMLKSFETFIELIEQGKVYITFKTGITKSGINIGKFHDHGTSFNISTKTNKRSGR